MTISKKDLLESLGARIRALEQGERRSGLSLGIPALEEALPDSRLPAGALLELLSSAEGAGAWTLALLMAKHVCAERKLLVITDEKERFYPPAAARLGIHLRRTLVIRPKRTEQVLTALVQSLRCPAVGAVIGKLDRLTTLHFRRLQLAAEAGGGLGILLRPATALKEPSFAAVRLLVTPLATKETRRRLQVKIVRLRDGHAGRVLLLEIDDEKGHVRLLPPLGAANVCGSCSPS